MFVDGKLSAGNPVLKAIKELGPELVKAKEYSGLRGIGLGNWVRERVAAKGAQLDQQAGGGTGTPALGSRSRHLAWARVLGNDYRDLVEQVQKQHRDVIDAYGATNPAEFFAVVTECFFEKPGALKAKHPALYDRLRDFYRRDPAAIAAGRPEELPG